MFFVHFYFIIQLFDIFLCAKLLITFRYFYYNMFLFAQPVSFL